MRLSFHKKINLSIFLHIATCANIDWSLFFVYAHVDKNLVDEREADRQKNLAC